VNPLLDREGGAFLALGGQREFVRGWGAGAVVVDLVSSGGRSGGELFLWASERRWDGSLGLVEGVWAGWVGGG